MAELVDALALRDKLLSLLANAPRASGFDFQFWQYNPITQS